MGWMVLTSIGSISTSNAAGISSSPDDEELFTLLMRDIRKAIGPKKLLTLATVASGEYIDFRGYSSLY